MTCSDTECDRKVVARRLCSTHYQRQRRARLGPEYIAWKNVLQRCTNPNHPRYGEYGGRGIGVDDRYLGDDGYANFLKDVGPRPPDPEGWVAGRAYWSLDRIDNDKGYAPGNLRWASPSEQALNRG